MDSFDPFELTEKAHREQDELNELAQDALQWFLADDKVGELYPREDLTRQLAGDLGIDITIASEVIDSLVGDIVDPIQQVRTRDGIFVGAIEYHEFNDSGAYGYIHHDDRLGNAKRVVCSKCVEENILDENITHATQGSGTCRHNASWQDLLNKITSHYSAAHSEGPETIEVGASLLSGTTISGNTALHGGNQSSFPVDSFGIGNLSDGEFLKNSSGSLVGASSSGGNDAVVSQSVANYTDLPIPASTREFYYVSNENDIVIPTDANLEAWRSISDFAIVLNQPTGVVSRPADDNSTSVSRSLGLVINLSTDYSEMAARISANTSSQTRVRVYNYNTSSYELTKDISGLVAGQTFILNYTFSSGVDYGIELDANGSSWTVGFATNSSNYPYLNPSFDVDIIARSSDGTQLSGANTVSINDIGDPDNVL